MLDNDVCRMWCDTMLSQVQTRHVAGVQYLPTYNTQFFLSVTKTHKVIVHLQIKKSTQENKCHTRFTLSCCEQCVLSIVK